MSEKWKIILNLIINNGEKMVSLDLMKLEEKNPGLAFRRYKEEFDKVEVKKMKGHFPSFIYFLIHSFIIMSVISILLTKFYFPNESIFIPESKDAPNIFLFIGLGLGINSVGFVFLWFISAGNYNKYLKEEYQHRFSLRNIDEIYKITEKLDYTFFLSGENNIFKSGHRSYLLKMPFIAFLFTRMLIINTIYFVCRLYSINLIPGIPLIGEIFIIYFGAIIVFSLPAYLITAISNSNSIKYKRSYFPLLGMIRCSIYKNDYLSARKYIDDLNKSNIGEFDELYNCYDKWIEGEKVQASKNLNKFIETISNNILFHHFDVTVIDNAVFLIFTVHKTKKIITGVEMGERGKLKAAQKYEKAGKYRAAIKIYEELKQLEDAGRVKKIIADMKATKSIHYGDVIRGDKVAGHKIGKISVDRSVHDHSVWIDDHSTHKDDHSVSWDDHSTHESYNGNKEAMREVMEGKWELKAMDQDFEIIHGEENVVSGDLDIDIMKQKFKELKDMKDMGMLNEEEFEERRKKLLGKYGV